MNTYVSLPPALVDFETIIANNEEVACRNATVIINQDGEATGWYDNKKPVTIMLKEEERAPVYSSTAQEAR